MKEDLLLSTKLIAPGYQAPSIRLTEHKGILMVVDMALVLVALTVGLWFGAQRSGWVFSFQLLVNYSPWFIVVSGLYLLLATVNDAYKPRVAVDSVASLVALTKTTVEILILYLLLYALLPPYSLPRHFVGYFTLIAPFLLFGWRRLYSMAFAIPAFRRRAIIVGAGWAGQTLVKTVRDFAPQHFEVIGFVDDNAADAPEAVEGVPVLGTTADLSRLVQQRSITDVVLAINSHGVHGETLANLLDCHEHGVGISTMPELYEHLTERVAVEHVGEDWFVVLPLDSNGQSMSYRLLKRGGDVLVALVGLILFSLILPVLALLIRLNSSGPIFYAQRRVGRAGREFKLYKLRSMVADAEADGQARWADKYDTRVTGVGAFLRQTRIDEAPQLVNVLLGDMSLIGPRPERPEFVAALQQEIPFYRTRLTVRPGLTGWAQVNYDYGRTVTDALEKLKYDLYYIKHQSLQLDLIILLKTVGTVLLLKGT